MDPVGFVRCVLGAQPTPYQAEILNALVKYRRVAVRGPHGLGKTTLAAWAVLWFAASFDNAKIPTTASAWRQLTKFLWPEIHKWARRADRRRCRKIELLTLSLRSGESCEAFAVASDNPAMIEGAHASNLLYVFDEAKAIPDPIWDAAEGAFATGNCYALAISTPGDRSGRFYDIHRRARGFEEWWTRHVTLDEAIAAGRISRDWAEARRVQWGENSPVYQARVLGEFPEQGEDTLISLAWIEAARERELAISDTEIWIGGLDVARYGSDDSVLVWRRGNAVLEMHVWHGCSTMEIAGRAHLETQNHPGARLYVDTIGVGAGVYDRLRELGVNAIPVNVSENAIDAEHFVNVRAERFWDLRRRFQNGEIDLSRLPRDAYDRLCGELTALSFSYSSRGQVKIEAKEKMRERLGHSPDSADALMLAFTPDTGWLVY